MLRQVATQKSTQFARQLVRHYSAINPTSGTGIAEAVKTAFSATAAMAILRHAGAGGVVRPKSLAITCTVAPASGTAMHLKAAIDKGTARYSSGGSSLTGKCRDMSNNTAAAAVFRFGALVAAAASADVRYINQRSPMTVIPVVGDTIIFTFTDDPVAHQPIGLLNGTNPRQMVYNLGPVELAPNQDFLLHTWYPSNATTPASWEVDMLWQESDR